MRCCTIAPTACRALAAKSGPALSTASTRTPRACWLRQIGPCAHHHLAAQFERHSVMRRYRRWCMAARCGRPALRGVRGASFEAGNILKITSQLARHRTDRQRQAVVWSNGRHAVTRARVLQLRHAARAGAAGMLAGNRAHAPDPGASGACRARLVGDPVYGGRRKLSQAALGADGRRGVGAFRARRCMPKPWASTHPDTGEHAGISRPLPDDMRELIATPCPAAERLTRVVTPCCNT